MNGGKKLEIINQVKEKRKSGNYGEALKICSDEITKLERDHSDESVTKTTLSELYYERAVTFLCLKKHEEALSDCKKALELNLENYKVYVQIGNVKLNLKEYEEAIQNYDKAIKKGEDLQWAYIQRGKANENLEKYNEAIEDYNNAIKRNGKDNEADITGYFYRGEAYLKLDEFEEAKKDFEEVLKFYEKNEENSKIFEYEERVKEYLEKIKMFAKIKNLDEVIKNLDEVIKKKVDKYYNDHNKIIMGDLEKAQEEFKNLKEKTEELHKITDKNLEGATILGLAESFGKLKESFELPIKLWNVTFGCSILAMVGISLHFKGTDKEFYKIFFGALPLILPLIWLAIFSGTRRNENNRLKQEYAHKEAVARTYLNYKKQIEILNIEDKELLIKLLDNTLNAVAFNASETLDKKHKEKTPYHELLELMCKLGKEAGNKLDVNKKDKNN